MVPICIGCRTTLCSILMSQNIYYYLSLWHKILCYRNHMINSQYKYGNKLDDSAFFRTLSYITKICYFEYLPSLLFRWQKPFFSPVQYKIQQDDSAFFRTQSYINELCYIKFLPNLLVHVSLRPTHALCFLAICVHVMSYVTFSS